MWKAALAGVVALATVGLSSVSAQEISAEFSEHRSSGAYAILTQANVARFKAALRLTPEQERYWPAVAAALRDLVREQEAMSGGMITRVRNKVANIVLDAVALKRLAAAAMPLLRSLDDAQKRDATRIAQSMGFGRLAAAF